MRNINVGPLNISMNREIIAINDKYYISTALLKKIWIIQFILKQLIKIIFIIFIFK